MSIFRHTLLLILTLWSSALWAADGHLYAYSYLCLMERADGQGDDWFMWVLNGLEARTLELRTADFLTKGRKYKVEIYQDDPTLNTRTKVRTEVRAVRAGERIKLPLQPSGGAALRFVLQ